MKKVTIGVRRWTEDGSSVAGGFEAVKRVKKRPKTNQADLRKNSIHVLAKINRKKNS
jgi:hypothetical protein